jgi:TRAP-type C4-dicarboxylate transport system permease small subunit
MSSPSDGLNHDRKTAMPALAVSIEVVTTVLLFMRISSRFTNGHSTIGVDDVLIVLAWITGLGLTIAVLLGEHPRSGLSIHL